MTYAMDAGDAARIETIKYSQMIIRVELANIRSIQENAIQAGVEPVYELEDRLNLIRSAWSVVDRVDATRQLFLGLGLPTDETRTKLFSVCRSLRNQMDHLGGNIKRLNSKKKSCPIYGVSAYQRSQPDDFIFDPDGNAYIKKLTYDLVGLSETPPNLTLDLDKITRNYGSPIGDTFLIAFDKRLCLTEAGVVAGEIEQMMLGLDARFDEQMRGLAVDKGWAFGGKGTRCAPLTLIMAETLETPDLVDRVHALALRSQCLSGPPAPADIGAPHRAT